MLASDQVPKYLIPCYLFFCDMPIKCLMKIFSKMHALKCSPFCSCFSDYIIYIYTVYVYSFAQIASGHQSDDSIVMKMMK